MKKYLMAGLGFIFLSAIITVHAEMELKVKDNTANNGFSIKEETTGSTIARFRGDGNVGIGTTNPGRKLALDDSSYPLLSFLVNGVEKGYIGWHYSLNRYQISTPGNLSITAGNAGGEQPNVLFINNSGNVGIGTTNPTNKLEINTTRDGDGVYIKVDGNNENAWFSAANPDRSWAFGIEGFRNDIFTILDATADATTGDGHRLCIDTNGNVGIGTTVPSNKLHVQGNNTNWLANIEQQGSGSGLLVKTASTSHVAFDVETGGIDRLTVLASGNIGIANTTPSYKLDVNGTIRGDNVSPSDMRWKEHVKTLDNSLEKVNKLRGVSFEWKDKTKGAGTQVGLIAQEVEAVFPEVVSADNEGYKSVAYDKLVGVLVEAVKEQQKQIEELKAERDIEIVALKASNEALKQEISSIKEFMSTHAQAVTVPASAQIR